MEGRNFKAYVRPLIASGLTVCVVAGELAGSGVSGEFITLYSMIMAFYFGEAASEKADK
jgi:hypothetical protein